MSIFNHKSLALFYSLVLFAKLFLDVDFLLTEESYGYCGETDGWKLIQWITFLSLISLFAGIVLSWRKSKIGWFLLLGYSIYAFFNLARMALVSFGYLSFSRTFDYPAIPVFDPITAGISSLLFVVLIVGFCGKSVRSEFGISQNLSVGITSLLVLFFLGIFLFF